MFVIRLYIFSTLIALNYANLLGGIFYKEPEELSELPFLEKLQGILVQSSETYEKAKEKIETASGFSKQIPEFLDYSHQLINSALSKFQHFFNKPEEVIKQLEDNLKIAKDLALTIDETLEKLSEILTKTEKITRVLQEISLKDIANVIEEGNEALHPPCSIEDGFQPVLIEVSGEIIVATEGIIGVIDKPMTEIIEDKEIVHDIIESIVPSAGSKEPVVTTEDYGITGHKPLHKPHHKPHKPLESELCNCEICSCEKSCRPSKGEAIQYIPCHGGTVCCIKKPKSGPYSTMKWETVLQLAMEHLHNNLDNME